MAGDKFDQLYNALKADGAVSGTREHFRQFVYAPGKQGYHNRKQLYDALYADGAVSSKSYEEFAQRLGLHAVNPKPQQKKPLTMKQRAQEVAAQYQQTKPLKQPEYQQTYQPTDYLHRPQSQMGRARRNAPGKASPFVQSLYEIDNAQKGPDYSVDYTSPKATQQVYQQNQQLRRQAAKTASDHIVNDEYRRQNQPMIDNGTVGVMKPMGEIEQEMSDSASRFVDANLGDYINKAVLGEQNAAGKRAVDAYNNSFAAGGGGGGGINDLLMRSLAYNEENDPDKMIENLANNARGGLEKLFQNPSFVAKVKNEADMLGVTPEAYVESMLPHLKDRLSAALEKSEYNKYLPKDAFENMANRFIDSNTIGKLVRGATMTRGQRIMQERASAATAAGENPYYKGSTVENVVADVAGMVSDPVFKGAAGAGGKVAGKLIGNSTKLSALMANGNLAQRLMAKGAQVVTSGGVTGFVFDSTGSVIQNYSTGEDTSLGNTLKVAAKGGTTGAVNFATMSLAGIPLSEVGRSIGLKAVKGGSFWGNTGRATAKIGLESGKTYMEAMGMYLGGYVSGKLEGRTDANGKPIEFDLWNGTMESLPTAIGFRLQHAVEGLRGGRKNEKGEDMGWFGSTIANFKDFVTSDKAKESRFLMTEDERNQIFSSGAMNGLMPDGENIVSYAKRTKNKKVSYDDPYLETDASMIKNTYDQIMADPKVSWDAKAKFSAMVTGIMPSARPMMDYITFSSEDYVKDGLLRGKRKYVNEYSAKGELLSKIPYDNKVDRDNVVYKHNIVRENQRLYNAMGLLARQDRNNYELQNDFFVENMKKPGADVNILVTNMGDEGSHVFRDFSLFALNSEKGTVLKTIDSVAVRNGMKSEDLIKAMKKNPMKRTDFEQNVCVELRRALEAKAFPNGKVHVEQSNLNGKDVAEDNNLGTEQPNGDAVKQELNGLRQAEEEVEVLMRDNDVFSQNFKKLQSQGLTNPQIYDWMVQQGGLTVEQLEPFAHYINANARVQGMQEATKQKIENVASSFVQDWSYKDTLNGVGMVNADGSAETVLFVYHDGKELIVGSGDVSFNQPNEYGIRRAKEDVGDMLVCFDPQTGQMVYVHASEVDYSREMKPEELKAKKILELQNINSVPYNEAAQEQAMQDAAENQDQSESGKGNDASETPEIVSEATPVETPTDFSFNNGKGRINSYKATPHEKTKSDGTKEITFSSEVTFTKGAPKGRKEGEVINIGNGGGFIKIDPIDIDYQQYAVSGRLHDDGTAFSKDEATSEDIAEAKEQIDTLLTPQLAEEMGPQYNVNKIIIAPDGRVFAKFIGMDVNIPLKRNPLEKAPQDDTTKSEDSTTKEGDLTKDNTTLTKVDTTSGKDNTTNENLAPQEQPQPSRKFADGSDVPMTTDRKGRPTPDYASMTPEQSAEILTEDFGENAEKVVDGQIQKAEKALKDAEKMKVDYTAEPNDIMEQEALKKKTVEAAKKQLDHAQNIKKAMTAKKVAETVGKTEQTEGAHEAGSVAAQKFVNAPRLVGNKRTRMLPDGETKIKGHYEIVPAEGLTPSHDVNNDYKKSEGFPTDAEGRTVNDRDYEHDKAAQQNTDQIARKYNGMAIEQVPVVSDEGIVYDGNGRTMAGQKAAKEGTDGEYINDLLENAENFGFTREQIEQSGIEHPRLVLVTDDRLPYDTATFAKFNRNEKKTQSNTEQAVAKAKTLTSDEVGAIVAEIEGNGSLEAFFNNSKAINDLVKTLVDKGIIGQNEVAQMMDSPERLSAQGREYVKNLLLGSIFKPETIRMLGIDSTVKNKAINAIRSVMDNMKLGEFSLRDEIDQAIQLLYEARQGGNKVDTLLRTPDMYVEDAAKRYPSISQMMALALEGKVADFRDLLDEYNRIAAARNTGEGNVFGEAHTKSELIKEFLDFKKWQDYGTGHSENEGGNDVSGVEKPQQEASGGNEPAEAGEGRVKSEDEDKPNSAGFTPKEIRDHQEKLDRAKEKYVKALKEAKSEKEIKAAEDEFEFTYKDHQNMTGVLDEASVADMWKKELKSAKDSVKKDSKEPSADPMEGIKQAADAFHEEQKQKGEFAMNLKIGKARQDYAAAKESGDAERTTKAAKELKHLLDDRLKQEGKGLAERQKIIAEEIGKAEAEIIDKPWEQMDLEEREAVSSKNPLTESEINELTSEENKELIPAALAYLRGDKGNIINAISYFKIWNDVRNRHENVSGNSGTENGTQLDAADTTGGEGLGLGRGRESGRPDGPVDRGAGNEAAPGERNGREGDQNDTTLSAGEQGNKQGEGNSSGMGAVPAGSSDTNGGGSASGNGHVSGGSGRESSKRPADTNAGRKPTAKQGTTFPDSTAERLKQERADYEKKKKDFWARWKKAGQGYAKIALTPFNKLNLTPEQIEMLPELVKMHLNGAVLKIKEGIYKFNEWKAAMLAEEGEELKMIGLSDDDIDRFIEDYWNTPYEMDGETHTIREWSSIYGNQQLKKKLKEPLEEKYKRQMEAEPIEVKVGDMKNIEETLPYLLPQQQEDVLKAETQFFGKEHSDREHAYGKGYLFTNGTGTGKTYTGLGIAKRLAKQGKGRILFITPSQKKVSDWIKDGKNLGLDIKDLDSWAKERGTTATTESGEGMVITTFANFGLNKKLLETEWDAVIYDECHRIMENKKGTETARSMQHYMVTNRDENHCFQRLQSINPEYQKMNGAAEKFDALRLKEIDRIKKEYKNSHPSATNRDVDNATLKSLPMDLNGFAPADGMTFPKLGKAYQDFIKARDAYNKVEPKLKEQAKDSWKNTKTIFLSATPFNTRENLDYVEGYIFKYPETDERGMGGRTQFYLNHFGAAYKFRYHRLEQSISNPDAVAKQEVAFSDYLQNTLGTMSGRIIDSPYDYSRDFPIVAPDHAEDFNNAVQDTLKTKYLHDAYSKTIGDYNYGSALFETMKVSAAIDRIKQHLDLGRKVVIFHRRVESKEPLEAPFAYMLRVANEQIKMMKPGKERNEYIKECTEFRNKYADLLEWEKTLDYSMPREQIAKVFGEKNVLFFSGKESKKVKDKAVDTFNDDDSGKNIIVIQEASGKEGISLHDTTSKHQRVCITLALPQSPITALQIEGRIYRIGNMSNAIFEYPILGLNSEMMLFGEKFNNQVSTTENLALGSKARNLRDSFANGILEHSGIVPVENQGVGGKEFDAATPSENDPFDNAVLDYYSNQKLNKNNREGSDYFPTPEPLGYKMVEWAGLGEGDSVLEPSAGHGAIARYVPKTNEMVSIEPSQSLFTKLQLKAGGLGRKFLNNTFENYALNNKHDVIVMNPPFGKAGALAIQHVDKAFKHLDEGGRIVAIIPRGSTDKKFDKWYNEQKNVAMRAEVNLPDILFQQAGTRVACRVVVLDKISDAALRSKAGYPEKIDLSGHYDKIEDFFNDLRDIEMPDRIIDTNLKMQKKAKAAVKDIMEINGVKDVAYGKTGINVSLRGSWVNYGISFTGSDKPNYWRDKMANYYTKYDELQKLEYQENKQAVFDELKKLSCKLAGMTEDEMQRYISNRQENGKTHFRIEENAENEGSSEKLFLSLQEKSNNKKEYNETVTELANRVKQGTARIAGEIEEGSRRGSSPNYGGLPAIAGKILNGAYKQGRGQSGEMAGGASDRKGEEVLSSDFVYAQIEDWAKENKCYFTEEDIAKGSLDGEAWKNGAEAYVYRSKDGKSAIKVMPFDPYYKNPVDYYLDRNRYFNDVFPDTAIEVMGYGRDNNGKFSIFYKQPLIEGETVIEHFNGDGEKANEYIDNMLANMGYNKKVPHDEWGCMSDSNGKYNIFDVNYSNVIIGKDGKPHVIDAEVLPVAYKNDGKTEIKDNDSETHFRNDNDSPVSISKDAPAVVKHVAKVAKATGGKVKMLQSVEDVTNAEAKARLEKGEKVEGWYDERTGEVVLYMPNVHDSYTAEKTVWHEIVGHKGMRELFGNDNYDKFLDDIYFNLDKPEYADLKKLVMKELQYNPFDYRNAIEEAIARMAEEGHGEHGLWNNLKNKVTNIFREIGYRVAPNTKDIKYLLWLSKNYSKHPESDGYFAIRRNALLHKLERDNTPSIVERNGMYFDNDGKSHDYLLDLNRKDFEEATDGKVHFRTSPMTASKIEEYNRRLGTKLYAFKESTVDNMQSLQEAMEIISGEKNAWTDIPSAFNPLQAQNRIDSIVQQKAEEYDRKYTKPLDDSFKKVVSTMSGSDKDEQLRNAQLYMITKHGLERNRVFFVRDAIRDMMNGDVTKAKTLMKDWNDKQKDLADELEKGNIRFDEYLEQMDEWIRSNVDVNFVADEHDYSGFHGMQNIAKTSDPYDDKLAIDNVMSAESQMGSDLAKDFWTKKKAATDYVIDQEYYNGFIDQSDRDYLKGMFQWYVPLRKFDDTTAEDVYGYIGEKGDPSNFVGPVLANAKGRSSLSDINVMAQISAMAKSSLINGGKNVVKQHFARFVSAYETGNTKDKIFVEVNPWLEKHVVDGKEVWEEVTPQIPENATQQQISNILQNFEDSMQAKKATGDAKLSHRNPNIGFKFQRAKDKSEHIIDVYIAGKKRSFVCQGNPRAAQALNGLVKDSGTRNVATRFDAKITRKIAQFNTSLNPDFMMSNMLRDLTFASANVTKEGFAYTKDFLKEYAGNIISIKNGKGSGNYLTMFRKYRDGKLDINNERERMFKEFMDNGGQTGFVQIKKLESLIDEYDNLIKKGSKDANGWFVKKIKEGGTFIETANEIIENVARYSTYCTSRKHGRSVGRSIYDAKEVSTNFNRHGSGDAIRKLKTSTDSNIDKIFRRSLGFFNSWMKNHTQFYNAGVQGANLFFKNYKSAWKTSAVSFGMLPLGLGIAQALINQYLINNEDEKDRKGVKDPYAELPEWKRRNNICIYTGHGNFKTIPIAIELRAFFGLGDIAAGYVVNDKLKSSTPIGYDILGQMAQLVPASDFLGHHSPSNNIKELGEDAILAVTPTTISPAMELAFNRDWTGRPFYRDYDYLDKAPRWKRAYDNTNGIYMSINKWANQGTNSIDSSNADMKGNETLDYLTAPYAWQHLIDSYTGGMGSTIGRTYKTLEAVGKGVVSGAKNKEGFSKGFSDEFEKFDKNQIPLYRVFNYTPKEGQDMQRTRSKWYNYSDELKQTEYNIKQLKTNTPDVLKNMENNAKKFNFTHGKEGKAYNIWEAADSYISKKKRQLNKASNPEVIKSINEDINRKMQEAVNDLDKLN